MRYRLLVVPTAERHIRAASRWWYENRRGALGLFQEELTKAFDLITTHPRIAPLAQDLRARDVRRFHLSRIHYHLYYRVRTDVIDVLALWHASRGSTPNL